MKINLFRRDKDQATTAKRQLLEALRCRDLAAINTLIARWQKTIGEEKLTDVIVNQVMVECDSDSHRWFLQRFLEQSKYQQMQQQAQNHVFHILVNTGLEPGKDFSFGSDSEMIISDRAKQTLLNHLPQEHRALFEAQLQSSPISDPIIAIEQQLGCAFFTNLTKIASEQMQVLDNSQAAAYLGVLLAGLIKRHPALQEVDFPTRFIFNVLQGLSPERATAILNDEETNPQFDESIICQDLLASLGEHQFHSLAEGEGNMSVEQLKQLDLVWFGERRLAEIVAVIPR
ncbi:hypothetical protein [Dendronalium sp. ChiSLP03b]|uniref:hypothetical protein n=1 Tax=Dendronalium sp. ChiSLP03b TaxID=3075381 RepID=UPI002AD33044|nr:hypothetical protein [Dendronalium sp. ChiSLP03b]MDZ8207613.1 hypothetical protein [Dendronalium sp. ChiSLP03b]